MASTTRARESPETDTDDHPIDSRGKWNTSGENDEVTVRRVPSDRRASGLTGPIQQSTTRELEPGESRTLAHSPSGFVDYDPGPNTDVLGNRYGIDFTHRGQALKIQRLEREVGQERIKRWADEGMSVDAMGKPRDMQAFRRRTEERNREESQERGRQDQAQQGRNGESSTGDDSTGEAGVPDVVREVISTPGTRMGEGVQREMESKMGGAFGDVRLHTGARAAAAADSIDARAFTVGNHVAFNDGEYHPDTTDGKEVLAHELTHVRQQTGGRVSMLPNADIERSHLGLPLGSPPGFPRGFDASIQPKLEVAPADDPAEKEAEAVAESVVDEEEDSSESNPRGDDTSILQQSTISSVSHDTPVHRTGTRLQKTSEEEPDEGDLEAESVGWELPEPDGIGRMDLSGMGVGNVRDFRAAENDFSGKPTGKPVFMVQGYPPVAKVGYKWEFFDGQWNILPRRAVQVGSTPFTLGVRIFGKLGLNAEMYGKAAITPLDSDQGSLYPAKVWGGASLGLTASGTVGMSLSAGVGLANVVEIGVRASPDVEANIQGEGSAGIGLTTDEDGGITDMDLGEGTVKVGPNLIAEGGLGLFLGVAGTQWGLDSTVVRYQFFDDTNFFEASVAAMEFDGSTLAPGVIAATPFGSPVEIDYTDIDLDDMEIQDAIETVDEYIGWLVDIEDKIARAIIQQHRDDGTLDEIEPYQRARLLSMMRHSGEIGDVEFTNNFYSLLQAEPDPMSRRYLLVESYARDTGHPPEDGHVLYEWLSDQFRGVSWHTSWDTVILLLGLSFTGPKNKTKRRWSQKPPSILPYGLENPTEEPLVDHPLYRTYIDFYLRDHLGELGDEDLARLDAATRAQSIADLRGGMFGKNVGSQVMISKLVESTASDIAAKYVMVDAYARDVGSPPEDGLEIEFWLQDQISNSWLADMIRQKIGSNYEIMPAPFRFPETAFPPVLTNHPIYDKWIRYYQGEIGPPAPK